MCQKDELQVLKDEYASDKLIDLQSSTKHFQKSLTVHLLRQAKMRGRALGIEHAVFEPNTHNPAVGKRFKMIQDII